MSHRSRETTRPTLPPRNILTPTNILAPVTSLRGTLHRAASAVDARTPAHRDRAVDGLRALALLAVPTGHWLLGGFDLDSGGALHNASPLASFGFFAPLSWVLQMLGIFFLVGGYASTLSYRRAVARGESRSGWLRGRLARLGRPVLGVTAVWAALIPTLYGLGVPATTLHTASTLVIQPLWFVGVYTVITALTPWCIRAAERWRAWTAVPLLGSVAVVDFLRYGPFSEAVPSWLSLLNLLPGWLFAYQLGVCWGEKKLGRRGAWLLLAGGTALFAALLLLFHYPPSMVGVPGEARTNSHPPSLLVLALAAAQSGAAILLRDRIHRLLRRPALWAPVVVINLSAMTLLCWHQTALLTAAIPGSFLGTVPGLTTSPDTLGWIAARVAWLPVLAGLLVLTGRYARRFEAPWQRTSRSRQALAGLLAAGFAVFALGLA
ncbi:acyltransferase [Streptomyces sp. NPDC047123]|uniref:acyltransferase family protein n=1 Tax=Streptomyces sp. NPDC047123 TaxID=3155622 RepID=UPI0033F0AE91